MARVAAGVAEQMRIDLDTAGRGSPASSSSFKTATDRRSAGRPDGRSGAPGAAQLMAIAREVGDIDAS
jgi:hypothetical protein